MHNYKFLSFKEAVQYLNMSERTLKTLIKKERIPYTITVKGDYQFKQEKLRYWYSCRIISSSKEEK